MSGFQLADPTKDASFNEVSQVACGGLSGNAGKSPVLSIGDAALDFYEVDAFPLPLIEVYTCKHLVRRPGDRRPANPQRERP